MINSIGQKIIQQVSMRYIAIIAMFIILFPYPVMANVSGNFTPDLTNVTLWKYNVDKTRNNYDNFWTATNPSKYIIPDNPVIRYFANNTEDIQMDYRPDRIDYWQNPDYTLKILQGDCEDLSLVWVSIHRAKGHKAVVVGGYLTMADGKVIRDMWYEYVDGNIHQTKFVAPVTETQRFSAKPLFMFNDKMSIRDYDPNWMNKYK